MYRESLPKAEQSSFGCVAQAPNSYTMDENYLESTLAGMNVASKKANVVTSRSVTDVNIGIPQGTCSSNLRSINNINDNEGNVVASQTLDQNRSYLEHFDIDISIPELNLGESYIGKYKKSTSCTDPCNHCKQNNRHATYAIRIMAIKSYNNVLETNSNIKSVKTCNDCGHVDTTDAIVQRINGSISELLHIENGKVINRIPSVALSKKVKSVSNICSIL